MRVSQMSTLWKERKKEMQQRWTASSVQNQREVQRGGQQVGRSGRERQHKEEREWGLGEQGGGAYKDSMWTDLLRKEQERGPAEVIQKEQAKLRLEQRMEQNYFKEGF